MPFGISKGFLTTAMASSDARPGGHAFAAVVLLAGHVACWKSVKTSWKLCCLANHAAHHKSKQRSVHENSLVQHAYPPGALPPVTHDRLPPTGLCQRGTTKSLTNSHQKGTMGTRKRRAAHMSSRLGSLQHRGVGRG